MSVSHSFSRAIFVVALGAFGCVIGFSDHAGAISGTGYYTGKTICSSNYAITSQKCASQSAPNVGNDVVPGRTSTASANSVPSSATKSTAAFLQWLDGLGGTAHKDTAKNFIIDTMSKKKGRDSLGRMLSNSDVAMKVVSASRTASSYYGLAKDGTKDVFFSSEWPGGVKDVLRFYSVSTGTIYYELELPCGNPVGAMPGLPDASNWSLYPQSSLIGGGTSGVVLSGGSVGQQSVIENTLTQSDTASNYRVDEFMISAGKSADFSTTFTDQGNGRIFAIAPGGVGVDTCAWLAARYPGSITCKKQIATGSSTFDAGSKTVDQSAISSSGYGAGDRVCRILWVDHYDYDHRATDERRVSLPACVTVAKTPYVQFLGGDVRAGDTIGGATSSQANVFTASNLINGNTVGSWAEYGIFAPTNGTIASVSGGALSGKTGFAGSASESNVTNLTFANTSTPKGNWSEPAVITSYENSFGLPDGGTTSAASISLDSFASRGKVTLTNGGMVDVHGTLPGGSLMLLYPTGTVVIDGNILLGTNSYTSIDSLSQIVIQAKNIIITHDVDRVDAWLVAIARNNGTDGGVVSTCDAIVTPYYTGLSARADSPCNQKPLRINGPVMGREVQLRRTFGADADNTAAEVINLRADAYLWTMQAASDGSIDTVFTTELPPRF